MRKGLSVRNLGQEKLEISQENKLVKERVVIKAGQPLFSLILLDCEVIVYLDISDELLAEHCKKRGSDFQDAKNVKEAIEAAWNRERINNKNNNIVFYCFNITE